MIPTALTKYIHIYFQELLSLTTAKSLGIPSLPPPVNAVILLKSESNFNVLLSIKMSDAHTKVRFVDVETYLKNVKKKKKIT